MNTHSQEPASGPGHSRPEFKEEASATGRRSDRRAATPAAAATAGFLRPALP